MKRGWKLAIALLAVTTLSAFVFIPSEPDEFEQFRKFHPISEKDTSVNVMNQGLSKWLASGERLESRHFVYGALSDKEIEQLRVAFERNSRLLGVKTHSRIDSAPVIVSSGSEIEVFFVSSPSWLESRWFYLKALFNQK